MYCRKCGCELPSNAMFCPKCGAQIEVQPPAPAESLVPGPPIPEPPVLESAPPAMPDTTRNFSFEKKKGFSYLTYKTVSSTAVLTQEQLDIESKTVWFGFIKCAPKQISIQLEDIAGVSSSRTWDFWDLAFATTFVAVTRMCHWLWLVAVLLFVYTAAGHCIEIQLKNGPKQAIPYSALAADNDFVFYLQNYLSTCI